MKMTMTIKLHDYSGRAKAVEVDLTDVSTVDIITLSGDQVAVVTGKDGSVEMLDSSDARCHDFFDGIMRIYDSCWGYDQQLKAIQAHEGTLVPKEEP